MATSTPIPPFFEGATPPPPAPSVLTAHTDITLGLPRYDRSLLQEPLPEKPVIYRNQHTNRAASAPYPKPTLKVKFASVDTRETSEPTSEGSSQEDDDEQTTVPKPPGEPGRPNRGGYNIQKEVGWRRPVYEKFRVSEHIVCCISF